MSHAAAPPPARRAVVAKRRHLTFASGMAFSSLKYLLDALRALPTPLSPARFWQAMGFGSGACFGLLWLSLLFLQSPFYSSYQRYCFNLALAIATAYSISFYFLPLLPQPAAASFYLLRMYVFPALTMLAGRAMEETLPVLLLLVVPVHLSLDTAWQYQLCRTSSSDSTSRSGASNSAGPAACSGPPRLLSLLLFRMLPSVLGLLAVMLLVSLFGAQLFTMTKVWTPLESNPDVLNVYASKIGLDMTEHAFCDVYGLDEEMLSMVPQPVLAVLMCFPITKETEDAAHKEDAAADPAQAPPTGPSGTYFMKQTIGNACGTIGLLHIIGNSPSLRLVPGSFLEEFFASTRDLDPDARGRYLETPPPGAKNIQDAHQAAASEGNTAAPQEDEEVDLHFVAFVHREGRLLQLDGRRPRPVDCGPTTSESLLTSTALVVQHFVQLTNSVTFNLMALTSSG